MARSAPPAPPVGRVAWVASALAVAVWLAVVATLPALRRIVAPPVVARVGDVAAFAVVHLWAWIPASWGVRGVAVGASAVGFIVYALFARFRLEGEGRPELPLVASLACAGAAAGVTLARPMMAAGLRGGVPLLEAALVAAIWWWVELIDAGARGRDRRPRWWIVLLGSLLGVLAGSPPFLAIVVLWPVARLVPLLRARGLLRLLALGFVPVVAIEAIVYLAARSASLGGATEGAPGFRGAAVFLRSVADGWGVVACLVALVGAWSLLRARQTRVIGGTLVWLALLFIPGDAPLGSHVVVASVALAVPVAVGIAAISRAFGRAAVPAAFVLAFMCAVWPTLDGLAPIVVAHRLTVPAMSRH